MRRAVGDLLGLGEEIVGPPIEHHPTDDSQRNELLGNELGRVQVVERKPVGLFLREQLHRQFPFGKLPGLDRLEHVATMEIRIGPADLDRLVPDGRLQAELRPPVELDEGGLAGGVEQAKAVHAETFDHPQRAGQRAIRHDPHHHVHRFRRQRNEVPERVVRGCRLRKSAIGFHLHRMNQVGKLDGVLDEEHGNVVADQVPVAVLGVELDREPAHVARRVQRTRAASDGRDAGEHGRAFADLGENSRRRELLQRMGEFEVPMHARSTSVDDAFRDALMVEMKDLLPEDEVLEQRGPSRVRPQRILVVRQRHALIGGEHRVRAAGELVQFTAVAGLRLSSGDGRFLSLRTCGTLCGRLALAHDRYPSGSCAHTRMSVPRAVSVGQLALLRSRR